ncbi:hypothetical protein ACLK13_19945 [Escherichia coli]
MLEQGVDILIGTTGRIIDYFKSKVIDLGNIQVVALDEADPACSIWASSRTSVSCSAACPPPPSVEHAVSLPATLSLRVQERPMNT